LNAETQEICLVFQKINSEICNVFIPKDEFLALGESSLRRIEALKNNLKTPQSVRDRINISYKLINIIYMPY
jgi:hypothetical protein